MSRITKHSGELAVLLLVVVFVAVALVRNAQPVNEGAANNSASVLQQGYPPPTPTAGGTDTPTPPPDQLGYMPAPEFVTTTVLSIASSPYADILVPLQQALDNQDAEWVASLTDAPVGFTAPGCAGGGIKIGPIDAQGRLDSLFTQGSTPTIQGYFEQQLEEGTGACIAVITSPYQGTVTQPTPDPDEPLAGPTVVTPVEISIDASSLFLCKGGGPQPWVWNTWWYGGYYELVQFYPLDSLDYQTYFVIRP